jgi:hypothetical protein
MGETMEFRPLKGDSSVATVAAPNATTLYRFDRNPDGSINSSDTTGWLGSQAPLNLARQQLNDDPTGRIYYTHLDGSQPMRWHNAAGENRRVGVPAPTTAPNIVSIDDSYIFTPDLRASEMQSVLDQAGAMVRAAASPTWTEPGSLPAGWVRHSDFTTPSDPEYGVRQRHVLRVFAVNPTNDTLIATYSAMPVEQAAWVMSTSLGGFFATLPAGSELIPAWAAGHTRWWAIPMRVYAQVFDIAESALASELLTLKMPGTQGAEPLLSSAQAGEIVAKVVAHGDKDGARVKAGTDKLDRLIADVHALFSGGAAVALSGSRAAFYARPDVAASLAAARAVFAELIWAEVSRIAQAQPAPVFSNSDNFA